MARRSLRSGSQWLARRTRRRTPRWQQFGGELCRAVERSAPPGRDPPAYAARGPAFLKQPGSITRLLPSDATAKGVESLPLNTHSLPGGQTRDCPMAARVFEGIDVPTRLVLTTFADRRSRWRNRRLAEHSISKSAGGRLSKSSGLRTSPCRSLRRPSAAGRAPVRCRAGANCQRRSRPIPAFQRTSAPGFDPDTWLCW